MAMADVRKKAMSMVLDWMIFEFEGSEDNDAQVVPVMDVIMAMHCTEKFERKLRRGYAYERFGPIVNLAERTRASLIDYLNQIQLEIMTRLSAGPRNFTHVSYYGLFVLRDERFAALMSNGTAFPDIWKVIATLDGWLEEALAA